DIEGSSSRVADQITWRRYSQEAKHQPPETGILGAPVVAFPNSGEELVRCEWQRADGVDLIEDQYGAGRGRIFGQGQSFNARKQSPDGTEQIVRAPELVGRLFLTQLLGNPEEEAETPLLGNEVLADGSEVDDGD